MEMRYMIEMMGLLSFKLLVHWPTISDMCQVQLSAEMTFRSGHYNLSLIQATLSVHLKKVRRDTH